MTFDDLRSQREELAERTSGAYRKLRVWLDKSVRITDTEDAEAIMDHVYEAAEELASCRKEELRFLEDPYKYMCKE